MTFPKHIWGGGVTLQMGLVIKRNVHSNPRASRTDGFHRGVLLWARYCTSHILYSYTYVRYLYLHIFLIIYIHSILSVNHTQKHRFVSTKINKNMKTLMRCFKRWFFWFSLCQVLRSHSCICRSPTWRPPPGFLVRKTPRFVGDVLKIRWRKWKMVPFTMSFRKKFWQFNMEPWLLEQGYIHVQSCT